MQERLNAMSHAIARRARLVTVCRLTGSLLVAFGLVSTGVAAPAASSYQFAQAAGQKPAAKPAQQAPADPTERQLSDLHKRLNITQAQQPQFDAFAQVIRQNAQEMNSMMGQEQPQKKTTAVEDLKTSAKMAQAEADGLKKLVPAMEALYASLSDQQKRIADQVFSNAPPPNQQQPRGR
jgi:hypothetical protein